MRGRTPAVNGFQGRTGVTARGPIPISPRMRTDRPPNPPEIYVDADACPVKAEVLRVAERHGLTVHMVGNSWLRMAADNPLVNSVVVPEEPDAADDWIAEHIGTGDIAITADIPLAARCLEAGAQAIGHTGKPFTEASIGNALAMRDLMAHLRDTGDVIGGGSSFSKQDRSRFLSALETAVQAARRAAD
jgi:uncharacterized protein YaiI (UPF0178 family)